MKTVVLSSETGFSLSKVELAESLLERMRGLLGRKSYEPGRAIWLKPCRSVHTFAMRFDLDLIFLDKDLKIVDMRIGVPPNKAVIGAKGARSVLELQSGWLDEEQLKVGNQLAQA